MNFIKNNKMLSLTNFAVGLFFLTVLMFKGSHNIGFILLAVIGICYAIYYFLIKRNTFALSKQDKWLMASFAFYVLIFLLSVIFNGGKMRELDNPSRALLVLPLIILFAKFPIRFSILLHCIPAGAFISGVVALIHRFVLNYSQAFQHQMHIQAGDIAMSLGLFSLAIALYFAIKKSKKYTALYLIASLFGVLGSVLSTARGGWVAIPVILVLILWTYRHQLAKKWLASVSLVMIGLIALALAIPQTKMMYRINQVEREVHAYFEKGYANTSLGARFDMWKSAILMAQEKPLLGWGTAGSTEQRKLQAKQKLVHPVIARFTHAHNQYLDDLSKRGILGLIALLGILGVPLCYFAKSLSSSNIAIKLTALLGTIHVVAVGCYGLSQGFFTHNSGSIFYFLVVIILYASLKNQLVSQLELD
ncbi:O-antigen ligase family protein [Pasteurellaceae bacterium 22721_9_1]